MKKTLAVDERPAAEAGSQGIEALEPGLRALIKRTVEAERALADERKEREADIRRLLLEIIEVSDAFERLFDAARALGESLDPGVRRWLGNLRTIHRLAQRVLTDRGVAEIDSLDQTFDPYWHQATDTVVDPERPDGAIVQQVQRGYVWRNIVLRKAGVVIVRND